MRRLEQYFKVKSKINKDLELLLEESDEKRILSVLQKNEIVSWVDLKKDYNLK